MRKHRDGYHHRGFVIRRCLYSPGEHPGLWRIVIKTDHAQRELSDPSCPHFDNLRDAERWIDDIIATTLASVVA